MEKTFLEQSGVEIQEDLNFTEKIFPFFSTNKTYLVDNVVRYGSKLYRCHTAVATAGAWTGSTNWEEYKIDRKVSEPTKLMVEVTWAQLKALRDNGQLVAGMQYRITDYECVTKQVDTRSTGNIFDIIVKADAPNKLSEIARACHSERDSQLSVLILSASGTYNRYPQADGDYNGEHYYAFENGNYVYVKSLTDEPSQKDVFIFMTDDDSWVDVNTQGVNKIGTLYDEGEAVTSIGAHFLHCNPSSWQVWYCLDNDTNRFAWALNEQAIANQTTRRGGNGNRVEDGTLIVRQPAFDNQNDDANYSEYQYAWGTKADVNDGDNSNFVYSKNPTLTDGENVFNYFRNSLGQAHVINGGKGVIYRLIDEFGNDCPYDFKNIQFRRYLVENDSSQYSGFDNNYVGVMNDDNEYYPHGYQITDYENYVWCYTFAGQRAYWNSENQCIKEPDMIGYATELFDMSVVDMSNWYNENTNVGGCCNNVIKPACKLFNNVAVLNNIVFTGWFVDVNSLPQNYEELYEQNIFQMMSVPFNNTFDINCTFNTFWDGCVENTFGDYCQYNTLAGDCYKNNFGSGSQRNVIGSNFYNNEITGFYCTFGNSCSNNKFHSCSNVYFKSSCNHNILFNSNEIVLGNQCSNMTFENNCSNITLGNSCTNITFGDYCQYNTFGNQCSNMTFGSMCVRNSFGVNCSKITFENQCSYNSFQNDCYQISFGNGCNHITFGSYCYNINFGNGCSCITFNNNYTLVIFEESCSYINLNATGSVGNLTKVHVHLGVSGASNNNRKTLTVARMNTFETSFVPTNSVEVEV